MSKVSGSNLIRFPLTPSPPREHSPRVVDHLFLRMMLHDLRSPLNSISHLSRMMLAEGDLHPGGTREMSEMILRAAAHMQGLVEDLGKLLALEAEEFPLEWHPTPLETLLLETGRFSQILARAKEIQLELQLPPDLPRVVMDPRQIRQVVLNLLDNAIKYAPVGSRILLTATLPADGGVEISVADQGPGILPEEAERIFEPFYRGSQAAGPPDQPGHGLGLYFCRVIAQLHRATLGVRPNGDGGARFSLTFPPHRVVREDGVAGPGESPPRQEATAL